MIRTGELPLSIGRLVANGCRVNLDDNNGFTLSSDISTVEGATKLDFSGLGLRGMLRCLWFQTYKRSQLRSESCAGPLVKPRVSNWNIQRLQCAGPPLPEMLRLLEPLAPILDLLGDLRVELAELRRDARLDGALEEDRLLVHLDLRLELALLALQGVEPPPPLPL